MKFAAAAMMTALALATASGAQGAVLFSQDFDSLPQGIPAASVPGFTIGGTVDVVTNGNFGITCAGNTGACVDIDGTPGPGSLLSDPIAFSAGTLLTVTFDLSGNQRGGENDEFEFSGFFGAPTSITGFSCTAGFTDCGSGDFAGLTSLGTYSEVIAPGRPFVSYAFSFTPVTSGTFQLSFASPSADNIGPILDNVVVSQVPEPASWALLIAGFAMVGAAARRRQAVVTA